MIDHRQRLAWAFLILAFISCLALVVAIPFGVNYIIQEARRSLDVTIQANRGTVGILLGDSETVALFTGNPAYELNVGGAVQTNATDQALMLVSTPVQAFQTARIQVYGNSRLAVNGASIPRFEASSSNIEIELELSSGRILVEVPDNPNREVELRLYTPQGEIIISHVGRYSITSTNIESQVAVFEGELTTITGNADLKLVADERATLTPDGNISGPLSNERNLISNGGFGDGLNEWVQLGANVEISGQPPVDVNVQTIGNEPTLVMNRLGQGHAEAGLRQIIGADVADYASLQLIISMEIAEQSLGVCGEQGSECPLTLRIEYTDVNDVNQTWQQGFYAFGDIGATTPDVCVACPPPLFEHQRVPFRQLVFFESDNLMDRLKRLNIQPQQVKSITVIASGHTFDTRIVDVALMARE